MPKSRNLSPSPEAIEATIQRLVAERFNQERQKELQNQQSREKREEHARQVLPQQTAGTEIEGEAARKLREHLDSMPQLQPPPCEP